MATFQRFHLPEMADGLCCQLTFPAPRIAPTRPDLSHDTQQNWEIPRNQLQLKRKLGDGNFGEVSYALFHRLLAAILVGGGHQQSGQLLLSPVPHHPLP